MSNFGSDARKQFTQVPGYRFAGWLRSNLAKRDSSLWSKYDHRDTPAPGSAAARQIEQLTTGAGFADPSERLDGSGAGRSVAVDLLEA